MIPRSTRLQYGLLVVEDGIKEMIEVSNFQIYTSYHVSIAQTILARLQTGTVSIENNIDKIFRVFKDYVKPQGHICGNTSSGFEEITGENRESYA